jgi:hypothetical protein
MAFRIQSNTATRLTGLVVGSGNTTIQVTVPTTIRYMRASGNGILVFRGANIVQTFSTYGEVVGGHHLRLDATANVVVTMPSATDTLFIELGRETAS